ncbi:MAG: hypothetical protein QM831_10420 [Kofleriaceae bacterium]
MRVLALVAVAACTPPASVTSSPAPRPAVTNSPAAITSIPNEAIDVVAIDLEGDAAVTSGHGSTRLWPSLDGHREPIVVSGTDAKKVALAKRIEGYAVATIDAADILTITRFTSTGEHLDRTTFDQIAEVVPTRFGFVAITSDRKLIAIEPGKRAPIATFAPTVRVRELVATPVAVLAIVDENGALVAHWLNPDLSFAPARPLPLPHQAHGFAVSPDRKRIASIVPSSDGPRAIELDFETGELLHIRDQISAVAYLANGTLALWNPRELVVAKREIELFETTESAVAVAADHVVYGDGFDLAVFDGDEVYRLGYLYDAATEMRATPVGELLKFESNARYLVDRSLGLADKFVDDNEPKDRMDYTVLPDRTPIILSSDETLAPGRAIMVGHDEALTEIIDDAVHYEPSTQLLAAVSAHGVKVFDLATNVPYELPATYSRRRVFLTDPALAHGAIAMIAADDTVWTITRELLELRGLGEQHSYHKKIVTIDRSGAVYLEGDVPKAATLLPSPSGEHYLTRDPTELALYTRTGTLVWRIALENQWATWSLDGTRLWVGNGGIARIDPATGAILARRCGFKFGKRPLDDEALQPRTPRATLCE